VNPHRRLSVFAPVLLVAVLLAAALAQAAPGDNRRKPKRIWLDPNNAPIDYRIQGEYLGAALVAHRAPRAKDDTPLPARLGAHVIALGDGTFEIVYYPGGLPGAGWDAKNKAYGSGTLRDEGVTFSPDGPGGYRSTLSDEVIEGKTPQGHPFRLKRTVRKSPSLGAKAPQGAIVLFDGTDADHWVNGKMDDANRLACNTWTKRTFQDMVLHVEFVTPFKPHARGQGRGNSGVYLQRRYEVQVLDSFGLAGKNNECGGVYKVAEPRVNMCLPPLQWQSYDIFFRAPRFDENGQKTADAEMTVWHNGVIIHEDLEIPNKTGGGRPEGPDPGPIYLQGHRNPVFYRNVWVVDRADEKAIPQVLLPKEDRPAR
jgi:hypothetical protein